MGDDAERGFCYDKVTKYAGLYENGVMEGRYEKETYGDTAELLHGAYYDAGDSFCGRDGC